jgi:transposase
MEVYAGLDLHSTNTYVAMIDRENNVLYKQRHRNDVPAILSALDPLKKDIQGVVVESTFNWYWLVDALMDAGYRVHLANASAIKQYEGLKQIDDKRSSLWCAVQSPALIREICWSWQRGWERLAPCRVFPGIQPSLS